MPDGRPDRAFGSGGEVSTRFNGKSSANAVAIEPSGKIVAGGVVYPTGEAIPEIALARYTRGGALDRSFGAAGEVTSDFNPTAAGAAGEGSGANAIALDSSGRIVVAGSTAGGSNGITDGDFAFARYEADGRRDTAFGSGGLVRTDFNPGIDHFASFDEATSLAVDEAGRIVAAGYAYNCPALPCTAPSPNFNYHYALGRYEPDGSLDASFGSGGKAVMGAGYATALALDPTGAIAIAGVNDFGDSFAAGRLTAAGLPDPGFGSGAVVTTGFRAKTWVTKANINSKKRRAKFTFDASGAFSELQCRLLSQGHRPRPFSNCPPRTKLYRSLRPGRYTFQVRAVRATGPERVPATYPFGIAKR
jgi:uncharacterized delta-60 repeat protein